MGCVQHSRVNGKHETQPRKQLQSCFSSHMLTKQQTTDKKPCKLGFDLGSARVYIGYLYK